MSNDLVIEINPNGQEIISWKDEKGNFNSMLKSTFDELQAAQEAQSL